jgi:H+/Cl- antiporter ClcA
MATLVRQPFASRGKRVLGNVALTVAYLATLAAVWLVLTEPDPFRSSAVTTTLSYLAVWVSPTLLILGTLVIDWFWPRVEMQIGRTDQMVEVKRRHRSWWVVVFVLLPAAVSALVRAA